MARNKQIKQGQNQHGKRTEMRCKNVLKVLIIIFSLFLSSCISSPTPIIIYPVPIVDVSSDTTPEDLSKNVTVWGIRISTYIQELINQIQHKVPYIDLREKEPDKKK